MKLTKYFMLAGAALLLSACSNSEDWNTDGGVTVEMLNTEMTVKENIGTFLVPLKLTGTTNGPVQVKVDVKEYSENPAKEDVNYIVTSKTVVFPTDSANVSIEMVAVNDMDINTNRMFVVTITSVEGGSIGTNASTTITIKDDDSMFYEAIQGAWLLTGSGFFDGSPVSNTISITGIADEDDPNYEKTLYLSGWGGQNGLVVEAEYSQDPDTQEVTLYIPYDQVMGQLNFSGLGVCDVVLYGVSGDYLNDEGGAYITVSPDLQTMTFDPDEVFYYGVVSNGEYLGGWNGVENMSMVRK